MLVCVCDRCGNNAKYQIEGESRLKSGKKMNKKSRSLGSIATDYALLLCGCRMGNYQVVFGVKESIFNMILLEFEFIIGN